MRIVSGFLKGKRLDFLKSTITRPIRDFVKESIFNIIEHNKLFNTKLKSANILDVYSGVGSFGIECISRGAKTVTFIESNNKALDALNNNLNNLDIEKQAEIFNKQTTLFFNKLHIKNKFDFFFFDPPFAENYFIDELKIIKELKIYKKKHLIIIHREMKSKDELNKIINIFLIKNYGRSKIIFGTF